jgi:hypothetical protein
MQILELRQMRKNSTVKKDLSFYLPKMRFEREKTPAIVWSSTLDLSEEDLEHMTAEDVQHHVNLIRRVFSESEAPDTDIDEDIEVHRKIEILHIQKNSPTHMVIENTIQTDAIVEYLLYSKGHVTYDEKQYIKNETFNANGASFPAFDWFHGFKKGIVGRRYEHVSLIFDPRTPKLEFAEWVKTVYLPIWQQKCAMGFGISVEDLKEVMCQSTACAPCNHRQATHSYIFGVFAGCSISVCIDPKTN